MTYTEPNDSQMGDPSVTHAEPNGLPIRFDNGFTLTNERTDVLTDDYQDSGEISSVLDAVETVDNPDLHSGCVCGRCGVACQFRPFYPCCGACMANSPHADDSGETPAEFWAGWLTRNCLTHEHALPCPHCESEAAA